MSRLYNNNMSNFTAPKFIMLNKNCSSTSLKNEIENLKDLNDDMTNMGFYPKKIKLKTKITLELKPSNNDSIERLNNHYSYKKITCESSFEYKKQKFEFKDEDILKNGLRGNVPGFIFLINELCNDDYDDKINN